MNSSKPVPWILASLFSAILLSSLGTSIANVALPTLARAFDASFQQVQWIVLAYLLSMTALIVNAGRLGDVLGRRRLLLGGIALFTVASIACSVAPALWMLIAARAAQGVGAAVMMSLAMALVAGVSRAKTGSAMGLLGTVSAVGTALGPTLGGLLIATLGWRTIFLINVPLGMVALYLAWRFVPADAAAMERKTLPLMPLAMLRDRVLSIGLATNAVVTTVVMATLVVGPFYLSGALALDAARVGLVMSIGPIVAALTGVPAGRIVDRFGTGRATNVGLTTMLGGALLLTIVPAAFGVLGYVVPLAILTAGYALFQAANNTAVMTNVANENRGVVSGMLNLSRNLGLIAGASLMGVVFALASATSNVATANPNAVASGMRITFAVAAALVAIALALRGYGSTSFSTHSSGSSTTSTGRVSLRSS